VGGVELILLDTHALIWLDQDDPALGGKARASADEALRDAALAVSAISFWEVAMLAARGRIAINLPIARWRLDLLGSGLIEIALDGQVALAASALVGLHRDPADRFIVATAQATGAALLTADQTLLDWDDRLVRRDARL
jgi:PIN domain nuclease of toxin-antitoxin system